MQNVILHERENCFLHSRCTLCPLQLSINRNKMATVIAFAGSEMLISFLLIMHVDLCL